ncbi:4-amino-4-deoxychorismate lyase [Sporosarcina sp. NCCP-2222]|uniref:aminodeoxychorismate lyase n=1 Tax=Sporosarcina sp. NCCP-2222 TaxID=2935073 RepID=UPI00208348AA|nr:aminodeoxychorismate lyase [Sporosarcina sp. NCCP-2222]GKV57774.1 4-amino-4-deoxychorismate lyase [Sporosarcina sp. NCCP-2222]
MICWMNGAVYRTEEILISPLDHGFLYGVGFFETFRTYGGKVFLFKEHMARLRSALNDYNISFPYTDADIKDAVRILTERSNGEDGYFRLNVSAGVHEIGLAPSAYDTPNVLLFRKELLKTERGTEKKAQWLSTPRNKPESGVRHKSHAYLNNVHGRLEIQSLRDQEGLFLTPDGFVAEGVTSNVFWVNNGRLYTPAVGTGILPGTTRAFIIQHAAHQAGLEVTEGYFRQRELEAAEEVFITNAIQEIVPIRNIGSYMFAGNAGLYYKRLHQIYKEAIEAIEE